MGAILTGLQRVGAAAALLSLAVAGAALAGKGFELPPPLSDEDFRPVNRAEAELGRLLFYDPILSGNRNIACATCHHPRFGTSDGLSLGLGEGGIGLGPERVADPQNPPEQRVPRNSQALFNLGAREMTVMFHDGRIEADPSRPGGIRTPLGEDMAKGFASVLAAQTMFPVLSADEMAGHYGENDVSRAVRQGRLTGKGGAWDIIAQRVAAVPDYAARFASLDPERASVTFADVSNAVAAFIEYEWRSDSSPFDAFLRGEAEPSGAAAEGMALFYGKAECAGCHSGPLLTDHGFHAMGAPQIGPGKAARFERHTRDEGRMEVTGQMQDAYAFRTPSLRNVVHTWPWGHAGAHRDLAAFIAGHAAPHASGGRYEEGWALLPPLAGAEDFSAMRNPGERSAIAAAVKTPDRALSDGEIASLIAFLKTLSDEKALAGRLGVPDRVPSGLPVPR